MNQYTVCLVFDKDDTTLLLMCLKDRTTFAGKFNGIGGKLEPGETPIDCAIREVKEETGCEPLYPPELLFTQKGAMDCTGKSDATDTCDLFYYAAVVERRKVKQQPNETELLAWIPIGTVVHRPEFFADLPEGIEDLIGDAADYVRAKRYEKYNGDCPFCGSENTELIEMDDTEERRMCHDCHQEYDIFWSEDPYDEDVDDDNVRIEDVTDHNHGSIIPIQCL